MMSHDRAETLPPKISIVTPSLNMGRYIEQCIRGVLWQDYPDFEHVIIDGGSRDGTVSILEKYPHLIWISEPDLGLSDALNKGVRRMTGDIVGWCCADDYYLPSAFKVVARVFREEPATAVVYGDYREIDADGVPFSIRREIDFDRTIFKFLHVNYIQTPATFWRRRVHDADIRFDRELGYAMDYDFLLRLDAAGFTIKHIPILLADFRRHGATKTATGKQRAEHEQLVRRNLPGAGCLPAPLAAGLRALLLLYARAKRSLRRVLKGHYREQRRRA